jgi:hypothetical protein
MEYVLHLSAQCPHCEYDASHAIVIDALPICQSLPHNLAWNHHLASFGPLGNFKISQGVS